MYLLFDTETSGLPVNYSLPAHITDNWPRVVQLAWSLYDKDGIMISSRCDLIKPDGWDIGDFCRQNGFTQEKNQQDGIDIAEALYHFIEAEKQCTYRVAHNIHFDSKIIRAEIIRLGNEIEFGSKKVCTMHGTTRFCALPKPSGRGGFKPPKLEELYFKLFNSPMAGAHDAGKDTEAMANCFFELLRLGEIKLEKPVSSINDIEL